VRLLGTLGALASGYGRHGASWARKSLVGWLASGGGPDEDIVDHIDVLRERSRDLFVGTPLATGALRTLTTNTVGPGLRLIAQIDAEALGLSDDAADAWERHAEREFALWTRHADAARTCTWEQLQGLALLSALMSGDVFTALPKIRRPGSVYDLRVQLIEADRVCDDPMLPTIGRDIVAGVEIGRYGEPVAYHVARYHPLSTRPGKLRQEWKRVPAYGARSGRRNMLHLMLQERPEQRRGVPILSPVIESLKQLGRYTDAELMGAVVSAMLTVFVKSETPYQPLGQGIPDDDQVDSSDSQSIELGNGSVVGLAPGESIDSVAPSRPNTAFDGFTMSVCVQIGAALEIPVELLHKRFTTSYTAARAAFVEFWKAIRTRRAWIAQSFCQPVYEEWLAEAVASERVSAPGFFESPAARAAWSGADWYGPSQGQINEKVEAAAANDRVQFGFSTQTRETAELTGQSWDQVNRTRRRELAKAAPAPQTDGSET